jgi:putative copper resistance protein D
MEGIMVQFLDIFGFLSVLLRGLALAFEALTVGGVIFQLWVAREHRIEYFWFRWAAALLAVTQVCLATANGAVLMGTTDLSFAEILGADFCRATLLVVAGALAATVLAPGGRGKIVAALGCVTILTGSTMMSHAAARLDARPLLIVLTLIHHVAGAAWIGGFPYLLIALRRDADLAVTVTARFSRLAMVSVAALVAAGAGMGWIYTGSAAALTGTTYGVMLVAKAVLTAMLLLLGFLNFRIVRQVRQGVRGGLLPLGRFAEAELGIGLVVLLAAASLTSTPPAVDVQADRVTAREIAERMAPRWPRMETPALAELSSATSLARPEDPTLPGSFVPGQVRHPNTQADIAWSEYNHHWAGLIVLAAGLLAVLSRRFWFARHWPLAFFGLGVFILIRADSENWPLGPRSFWQSFQVAEVAQHRFFVLLVAAFAIFEWAVQTHRLSPRRAGLVFPLVCAVGGAILMTHEHSLGNVKDEFLAELSHIPLALLAVVAGWSRWLEIRLTGKHVRVAASVWPVCLVLIGVVLVLYRES